MVNQGNATIGEHSPTNAQKNVWMARNYKLNSILTEWDRTQRKRTATETTPWKCKQLISTNARYLLILILVKVNCLSLSNPHVLWRGHRFLMTVPMCTHCSSMAVCTWKKENRWRTSGALAHLRCAVNLLKLVRLTTILTNLRYPLTLSFSRDKIFHLMKI